MEHGNNEMSIWGEKNLNESKPTLKQNLLNTLAPADLMLQSLI